jgi:hypothetical protein
LTVVSPMPYQVHPVGFDLGRFLVSPGRKLAGFLIRINSTRDILRVSLNGCAEEDNSPVLLVLEAC